MEYTHPLGEEMAGRIFLKQSFIGGTIAVEFPSTTAIKMVLRKKVRLLQESVWTEKRAALLSAYSNLSV
ncbi:hypothetical protein PQQ99_01145 [Paraburkholderia sediminicola]|uniref:hypothetical protein n=1 Tax=Paraburkholderia sediminicola TaxID=458836 RepID=UPI0038BC33F0